MLYLETTILSYLAARPSRDIIVQAHQQITWDWWESEQKKYELYISEIVLQEINRGDPEVVKRRQSFISNLAILDMSDAVHNLAYELAKFLKLPQQSRVRRFTFKLCHRIQNELSFNLELLTLGKWINYK